MPPRPPRPITKATPPVYPLGARPGEEQQQQQNTQSSAAAAGASANTSASAPRRLPPLRTASASAAASAAAAMASQVQTLPARKPKFRAARAHDYIYDPTYVLSCPRDLQRCEQQAIMGRPEVCVRPNFRSMFSEQPRYPALRLCLRCPDRGPNLDTSWAAKLKTTAPLERDVRGADRHLFFRHPPAPAPAAPRAAPAERLSPRDALPALRLVRSPIEGCVHPLSGRTVCMQPLGPSAGRRRGRGPCSARHKASQTDFRESEAQTSPWEPPAFLGRLQQPEVLTLAALSWENGLPAGWLEVDLIERLRVRRAWEARLQPERGCERQEDEWRRALARLDRDTWLLRERELQAADRERLRLASLQLEERRAAAARRLEARLRRAWLRGARSKEQRVASIRHARDRELRKLTERHHGMARRYRRLGPIEAHADYTSQLYGPLARYGADPAQRHERVPQPCSPHQRLHALELLESWPPAPEPAFDFRRQALPRKEYILCQRETRWTEEALDLLLEEMKGKRESHGTGGLGLVRRIYQESSPPSTPSQDAVSEREEELYQATVFLQKLIKGRAVQCLMYQGLQRCRELILELRSTHGLDKQSRKMVQDQRARILDMQEEEQLYKVEEGRLAGLVRQLAGGTLGSLADFLHKELVRLQDERVAHAFALLAERARQDREAAEAGRRQAEERRRREHDEIFRQVLKVHQESVDVYLEDVILRALERTADEEARRHVRYMAARIDAAAAAAGAAGAEAAAREELVAELLHAFLLPEVEKRRLQAAHLRKQRRLLQAAHDEVFGVLLAPRTADADARPTPPTPDLPEPPLLELFPGAKPWTEPFPEQLSVVERLTERPSDHMCWQLPSSESILVTDDRGPEGAVGEEEESIPLMGEEMPTSPHKGVEKPSKPDISANWLLQEMWGEGSQYMEDDDDDDVDDEEEEEEELDETTRASDEWLGEEEEHERSETEGTEKEESEKKGPKKEEKEGIEEKMKKMLQELS